MSELSRFMQQYIQEAHGKKSLKVLYDSDPNKMAHQLHNISVDIASRDMQPFFYKNPKLLCVYPSKKDIEDYLLKSEQFLESIHQVGKQIVFEIGKTNKKVISCYFYGEESDIAIVESAVRNFFPNSITEQIKESPLLGNYYCYDFLPKPGVLFNKPFSSYKSFIISPINLIPQMFLDIEKGRAAFQVIIAPLPGEYNDLLKNSIDTEWAGLMGADTQTKPSLQSGIMGKKIEYKSSEFPTSYYAVCARIILPTDQLLTSVKTFISNYSYGSHPMHILDSQHYSQDQTKNILVNRASYRKGWVLNTKELTSLVHVPYQVLNDKAFDGIFASVPCGDRPIKTAEYQDIVIGKWACGNSSKEIRFPIQREIPNTHIMGIPRVGKSIFLQHAAMEKFNRGETVFVIDPVGELCDNIRRVVPKERIDDVIELNFGIKGLTPQLTLRANMEVHNPSKFSDDLTESFRDATGSREKFWGPRMSYAFSCLLFIYSVLSDLDLTHIRRLISRSPQAKALRTKVKARIKHPIVKDFLSEIEFTSYETLAPVISRLSHLLLDEGSLRLFTLEENKISIHEIMESGKLCLVNLACGIIGKKRSSILSGLIDGLITNNALARANIPYEQRKPCTIIKDEFYLGPGDVDFQMSALSKYNLSVMLANQYFAQVEGRTRDVLATAGTRIMFKLKRQDAEIMGRDFNIDPAEFTALKKFQAIVKIEDEVVKVNTPRPAFPEEDYSHEIMQNCIEKYYIRHEDAKPSQDKKQLSFDTL